MVAQLAARRSIGDIVNWNNLVHLCHAMNRNHKPDLLLEDEEETAPPFIVRILEMEAQSPFTFMFDDDVSIFISAYLVRMMTEQKSYHDRYIALPSIAHLSMFFSVSEGTARDALEKLRKAGHKVVMPSAHDESPVLTLP